MTRVATRNGCDRVSAGKQAKNAEHQGSAPSFEEDSGLLGVKKEINCVPIMLGLMQKGVYLSYTLARLKFARWGELLRFDNYLDIGGVVKRLPRRASPSSQ